MFVPNFMKIERGEDFFLLIWHGMTLIAIPTIHGSGQAIGRASDTYVIRFIEEGYNTECFRVKVVLSVADKLIDFDVRQVDQVRLYSWTLTPTPVS